MKWILRYLNRHGIYVFNLPFKWSNRNCVYFVLKSQSFWKTDLKYVEVSSTRKGARLKSFLFSLFFFKLMRFFPANFNKAKISLQHVSYIHIGRGSLHNCFATSRSYFMNTEEKNQRLLQVFLQLLSPSNARE